MKPFLLVIALTISTTVFSQQITKCVPAVLEFETPLKVTPYDTEISNLYGYENSNNYAIDIEAIPIEKESEIFKNNIKKGAYEFAKDMGFTNLKPGTAIKGFRKSFYVIAYETIEDTKVPVFIIVLINDEHEMAYEITIYCYNQNEEDGKLITESIKPLQTNKS